jgi:uncharacterized membrane protein YbhN (UPF0104 family)
MIRKIIILFSIIVSIAVLWYFFSEVWFAVLICMAPMFVLMMIHGERIDILSGRRLGVFVAAKGNSLALTGAFLVPGRVTEILKPLYFKRKRSLSMADGVSILLVERFYDLVMVLFMGVGVLYFLPVSESGLVGVSKVVAIAGIVFLLLSVIIINIYPNICVRIINLIPFIKMRDFLISTFNALKDSLSHGLKLWQLILTVVGWLGAWALYWFYLQWDGGVSLTVYQALAVFLVGTFGLTVTVTPGGLGTFEAAVALLLQHYGYPLEVAFASAIGLRLVAFLPNAMVALYVTLAEGFDFMRARQTNGLSGDSQ